MKRVLIIRNAFKHDFGGAEIYAMNLAVVLHDKGYIPILVTRVPTLLERSKEKNIKTIKGLWYSRQGWGRFYRLFGPILTGWYVVIILINKIDIIHAQSRDDFIFATKAAKLLGKKVVWTDHADLKYIMEKHNAKDLRYKILSLARYASKVIVVSNSEKTEILKRQPNFPNIEVIHNGVLIPNKISKIKKPNKIIIGSTSRLVSAKGISELIEGYSKISNLNKTQLWLIGEGPEKQKFQSLSEKLGVDKNVKFLGYKKTVWPYLKAFDIYVQPTYHEAFSTSLIEASIAGCAVVTTRVGGNTEIINGENGILIPPRNYQAITKAIETLMKDTNLRNIKAKRLRNMAINNYDFAKIVNNKVIPIYEA